jgi:hypothetical protein
MTNIKIILLFISIPLISIFAIAQDSPQSNEKKDKIEIAKLEKTEKSVEKESAEKRELKDLKYRLLQDNGFLVEEAFAQESDSIQHTYRFRRSFDGQGWEGVFEEEMPLGNEKHQLSISLPSSGFTSEEAGKTKGFGDVEVNYRYQLVGGESSRFSVAPGISAILPSGNYKKGLGSGSFGMEFSLPVTIAITKRLMSHSSVGVTYTPYARNVEGERAATANFEAGQSLVWLAHPKFNPLIEFVWERRKEVIGSKLTKAENEYFVSPGFRWGHMFKNGLKIVPGVAFPIGVGSSKGENGIFFYLSFEHPFKKRQE